MRSIVHLSDIHFGSVHAHIISPLIEAVRKVNPDLVAVSGDLPNALARINLRKLAFFSTAYPNRRS